MIIDYEDDGVIRWERNGEKKHAELIDLIEAYEDKQKRGRWDTQILDGIMGNRPQAIFCDKCGQIAFAKTNYCPNCGADMREVEE